MRKAKKVVKARQRMGVGQDQPSTFEAVRNCTKMVPEMRGEERGVKTGDWVEYIQA
jgi:hypothetical protein